MNLEIERYEGEIRYLRDRVKELEIEVAHKEYDLKTLMHIRYAEKTVEADKFW